MLTTSQQFIQFVRSALLIALFLILGKGLTHATGLSIPGSIFGLLLLFLALNLRMIRYKTIVPASNFLLNFLTLFFVPVGVGLIQHAELLRQYWLAILVSSIVSTVIVLVTVGWCYQRLSK